MVIGSQTRLGQALGLVRLQHAERDAGFHVEAAHAFNHFDDSIELLAVTHLPPGSPHTETLRTRSFGRCCHRQHLLRLHQQVAGQIHLAMMGRLRAVGAIFRTATRLDRQEARLLHPVRVVILPVNRIGAAHEFQKRKPIERRNLVDAPVMPDHAVLFRILSHSQLSPIP